MSILSPFKIRKYLCEDSKLLMTIATDFFGPSYEQSHQLDLRTNAAKKVNSWRIYDQLAEVTLTISHVDGSENIDIHYNLNFFNSNVGKVTVLRDSQDKALNVLVPKFNEKLYNFISTVKKPWEEWTEDEILKSSQWIYYFYLSNGNVSEAMHTAMVLGDPDDPHVKNYFSLWQKQKSQLQTSVQQLRNV